MNLLLVFVSLLLGIGVFGMHNITIDDLDPSITYTGVWDAESNTDNPLAYDGAHHVSFDSSATAKWQFTGIAFYYIAPLWAYPVNTIINIDNGNITYNVDLDDHALPQTESGLQENIGWSVLWGSGELENTLHTVVASMPPGGPQYVVVDAFMYTVLDPGDLPTTTVVSTPIVLTTTTLSTFAGSPTESPASGAVPTTKSSSGVSVPLVAGLLAAALSILAAILIYWLCRRRRNSRTEPVAAVIQPLEARYSFEKLPSVPAVQPPLTPQNSACLLCRSSPKNGEHDFCGTTCRDALTNLAPLVLEVPQGHSTFTMVENYFRQSWRAGSTPRPRVKNVYRIIVDSASIQAYDNYLMTYGNESFRYHGTERTCPLGVNGHTALCTSPTCNACSIIRTSFKVTLSDPGRAFGQGIYTSSASNKSASYSPNSKIMFLTKVVLGNIYTVNEFAEVKSCPPGYQSVVFNRLNGKLNETVVYTNDAIRPMFLIAYE